MSNSICAIGLYYGKFNNYFPLWLKSCSYNSKIDFIIVTDIELDFDTPRNVKTIKKTLQEIKDLACKKFDMNVALERPYKCCDLRPFYGILFSEYLKDYDYWGWFDFDVIFGNLWTALIANKYTDYDKFLPLGHLSFLKNTDSVNRYYLLDGSRCGDYKTVLSTEKNCLFDENCGINAMMLKNKKSLFMKRIFADISPIFNRFTLSKYCSLDSEYVENYPEQVFYWENGRVLRDYVKDETIHTDEFMYLHMRSRPDFPINFDINQINSFYITKRGFVPKNGPTTRDSIKKLNPCKGKVYEYLEEKIYWLVFNIRRAVKKIGL
jgi:hypothetical protein